MSKQNNMESMARSAALLSAISAISLLFSFLQESILAYFFGTSAETDAYTVAIQLPVILFSVVSTAISTIIIPNYSKELYGKGKEQAQRYASNFMTTITLLTIGIVIICEIFAEPIMLVLAPGLKPEINSLTANLFRIVLPTIILTELMNINSGILNVHKSFVLPALTSNILNVVFVGTVFFLARNYGIYSAILGTTVGTCLEFVYSVLLRRRYMKYKFVLDLKDDTMKLSLKMALPVFVGIGADEISKIVDKMVSSFLAEGSIASLNFASKLSSAVSTLLINGISTVIYPEFARNAAEKDEKGIANTLTFSLKTYILIIMPLIFGGTYLSKEIVAIVFMRGSFDMSSVERTAPLFACYLACLLFTAFRQASSRFFYAQGNSVIPMKNSVIGIALNIILNILLAKWLGAFGLALATTISMAFISILILAEAKKKNDKVEYKSVVWVGVRAIVASVIMTVAIILMKKLFVLASLYNLESFGKNVLFVLCSLVIGVVVYFAFHLLIKTNEIKVIMRMFIKKK